MAITKPGDSAGEARRGRGRPQLRSDEETLAVILGAARTEFSSGGYAATNMESVARRAGISTRTLYRLIPNKASLFETMITDRMNGFASAVRRCPNNAGGWKCTSTIMNSRRAVPT